MKIVCSDCEKAGYGTQEQLIKKGWNRGYGWIDGKRFSHTCCPTCFAPSHFNEAIKKARETAEVKPNV